MTANLANHWASVGWKITVVTLSDGTKDFYVLSPNVQRIKLDLLKESPNPLCGMENNLRRVIALRLVLRQVKPDVALSMMDSSNIKLALASFGLRDLVIIGSERIHPPLSPLGKFWETLRRYSYARLDTVVALTEESADWLRRFTRAKKVVVIPNVASYPISLQQPQVAPPAQKNGICLLLAVGRLSNQKGFDILIAAFQQLAEKFPNWQLAILGEGSLRNELAAQIASAGLTGRILLPGRVGNVGDWYTAADLYVMTSRFEGFPNTLAEAMAHGLAAVSVDCDTGPRDIIRNEVDGLLVQNCEDTALVSALERLMGNESLRQQFATRAIEVRERFSMARITAQWEELFEELQHGK